MPPVHPLQPASLPEKLPLRKRSSGCPGRLPPHHALLPCCKELVVEVQAASLPECCKELVVEVQAATLPEKLPEKLDIPHLMILPSHSSVGVYDAAHATQAPL